jgi:hypothetical protein
VSNLRRSDGVIAAKALRKRLIYLLVGLLGSVGRNNSMVLYLERFD